MLFWPYRSYIGRVMLSKSEKRALRWAAELLLPPMAVAQHAQDQGVSPETLAESFGVTPSFVRAAAQIPTYIRLVRQAGDQITVAAG